MRGWHWLAAANEQIRRGELEMSDLAFTPHERGASAYVCANCTNRFYTYAETPPSPCAVCGSDLALASRQRDRPRADRDLNALDAAAHARNPAPMAP
jgi:DNA-directed RNA polymerase subunit RPC12/RpoP